MRVLDLFSGIGGISLGLERAGMTTVAFCEVDPFCRAVLRKHWPDVPIHEDIRTLTAADVSGVDLIAGGFPCQDISAAGKGAGIHAERSGLWWQMRRLIDELRPAWVLAENVPALRTRGADEVLASLEELGYAVVPVVVGAWAVGAPHRRDRVWIVAHSARDADSSGRGEQWRPESVRTEQSPAECGGEATNANREPSRRPPVSREESHQWLTEPALGRVAHGVPNRVDRLRALGNSVVPQVVEAIGKAIMNEVNP